MNRFILLLTAPLLVYIAACTRDPKEMARTYVETGNKYYDKGNYKAASIMYRRALQKNMRDAQAYYRLGLVQMKQGMMKEARGSFLRTTDIDHGNMDALAKLGDIDLTIYLYDPVTYKSYLADVRDVVNKLLAKGSKSYDGLRLAGFVAIADKDVPRAIQKFREANAVKPDQPETMLALAQSLLGNKQPEEAERTARELIAKHKDYSPIYDFLYTYYATTNRVADAEGILKQRVANNPGNAPSLLQLAFHYSLTRQTNEMNATLARMTSDPKMFPQGHLLVGDFLMRVGLIDRALSEYQQGEKSDTKNKATYGKRAAEALTAQGRSAEAAQVISRLIKENPKDPEVVAMHASVLVKSKDPKQIQTAIDELLPLLSSTQPGESGALQVLHFNLGRAYLVKEDAASLQKAQTHLQEALKLNPAHGPARLAMAELLLLRGESQKALQAADEAIKLQPNTFNARLYRTKALINLGENQRARAELNALRRAAPSSTDVQYQIALLDVSDKHFKDAEEGFAALSKVKDPRGFMGLVQCKVLEGDLKVAIQIAKDQLRQTPDNDEYRRLLVDTEYAAGRFEDGIADFQPLLTKDPSAINYMRLGEIQRKAKEYDAAIVNLKKAQQLRPTEPGPVLEMALVYDFSGRSDEARQAYEKVLTLQPDNILALNNLAYSMAERGVDLDKALSYAERAHSKMPNDLELSDTIALIYLRKNQIIESTHLLSDLVNKAPNNSTFHLHYANALYQKGDRSGARKELDAATRTGPTDKEKQQIQELRQKLS
jgi:tetratricopeptide (TPR) repeat protein